ncbi:hypothetical protein C0J52_10510 [Blattella germanica]|nr:hypothetical protein C0J52_10510 [Blattella germanica]
MSINESCKGRTLMRLTNGSIQMQSSSNTETFIRKMKAKRRGSMIGSHQRRLGLLVSVEDLAGDLADLIWHSVFPEELSPQESEKSSVPDYQLQ